MTGGIGESLRIGESLLITNFDGMLTVGVATIEPGHIKDQLARLEMERFSFDNFMRLVTSQTSQTPAGWDDANAWGMKKLDVLDEKRVDDEYNWTDEKYSHYLGI